MPLARKDTHALLAEEIQSLLLKHENFLSGGCLGADLSRVARSACVPGGGHRRRDSPSTDFRTNGSNPFDKDAYLTWKESNSRLFPETYDGLIFASPGRDDFSAILCRFGCPSLKVGFRWYGRLRLRGSQYGERRSARSDTAEQHCQVGVGSFCRLRGLIRSSPLNETPSGLQPSPKN